MCISTPHMPPRWWDTGNNIQAFNLESKLETLDQWEKYWASDELVAFCLKCATTDQYYPWGFFLAGNAACT